MNCRVLIQTGNLLKELGFCDGLWKLKKLAVNACLEVLTENQSIFSHIYLFGSFQLHANICGYALSELPKTLDSLTSHVLESDLSPTAIKMLASLCQGYAIATLNNLE